MDDISKLADRLLLISKGSIFYDGTVENFVKKSGQKKQLCVIYEQPLNQNIQLRQDLILTANSREHHLNVEQQDLSWVLPKLTQAGAIQDLKFEEINFEDTIKDFLIQQT
jgi:ABC-2 type transport system ATP-binding protein